MLEMILNTGKESGFETVEVFQKKMETIDYSLMENQWTVHRKDEHRVSARAFWETGNPLGFTLSCPDGKSVKDAFRQLRSISIPDRKKNFSSLLPRQVDKVGIQLADLDGEGVSPQEIENLLEKINENLTNFPGLKLRKFFFSKCQKKIGLANTMGLMAKYRKTLFHLALTFSLKPNWFEVRESSLFFKQLDATRLVTRAFNILNSLGSGSQVTDPVEHLIFSPEASTLILREFSDYFKLDSAIKKRGMAGSSKLSILDHSLLENRVGSVPFDDEGTQTGEKYIINKGIFISPLSDIATAFSHNRTSTGNGFRSERSIFPIIQFSNLYIKPGAHSLNQMMREAGKGILVLVIKPKFVEPQKNEYLFSANGYTFANGETQQPLHFYFKTTFLSFILKVLLVSRELRFFYSHASLGAPYVLLNTRLDSEKVFHI